MKLRRLVLVAVLLLPLAGCGGGEDTLDADALTIAVIPKGTTHEFWKSIHAGAIKAQRELAEQGVDVQLIWKGPLKEDDREQQIQVVENFIGRRVDGIVLAPLDADALVAPTEAAMAADIPVVIVDSDLNTQQRVSYIATDNHRGGQLAGEHLARLLDGQGNVILLRYQAGSASTEAREAGFLEAIRDHPAIRVISSGQHSGATRETAYQAAQNLLNRYGHEVNGIFTPNESSTIGMLLALRDVGRAGGDVRFVGFDVGAQLIGALEQGQIQGLVVQNPMAMGYEGVMTMVKHLRGDPVPEQIDTGVTLVTPDSFEDPDNQELLNPPIDRYLDG